MRRRPRDLLDAGLIEARLPRRRHGAGDPPLYEMVDSLIRKRLVDNVWRPGDTLPSEVQLAREFGVSQGTVRKAIDALVAEGVLTRRQGVGTFVSEMRDRRELFLFFNMVGADGHREMPAAEVLSREDGAAGAIEAKKLALDVGAPVVRLKRLRLFRGAPRIFETVVIDAARFPGFGMAAPLPDHLFRHYEMEHGVTVVRAAEQIRAVAAGPEEAAGLRVQDGAPLLRIDRVAYSLDDSPVEWRVSLCNTVDFDYLVERG
jgi:Transcriptional regulators